MAKIKVKCEDFVWKALKACQNSDGDAVFASGQINVDFDLEVPESALGEVKPAELQKLIQKNVIASFSKKFRTEVADLVQTVEDYLLSEAHGDSKASSDANKAVGTTNDLLKKAVGDLRDQAREAIVSHLAKKGSKITAKQLTSIGSSNLKEIKLEKGAFKVEPPSSPELADITPILKRSNGSRWIYFGIAATGTAGRVLVDLKKKIKPKDLKELRKEEDVPDNALFYEGVIRANTTEADLHFVKKTLKDKDIKTCFKTSAPKFGTFKIRIKQIDEYPKDLKNYEG